MAWPRFGDMVVIYTMLTPLCVLYWHSTFALLDYYLKNNLMTMLVGGYFMVVLLIILHDTFRCVADSFEYKCIWEFIYDYTVFTACLSYIHGCRIFYNMAKITLSPIAIAVILALFLIVVQGFRNIIALPAVVNNDKLMDRYRPESTLIFFGGVPCCIENDIFLASIVWPSIALLWEGLGEFLLSYNLDKFYMLLYGYIAVALLQTLIRQIVETYLQLHECNEESGTCDELLRIVAEDLYIFFTAIAIVLVWKGLDGYCSAMMAMVAVFTGPGINVAVSQIVSFSFFWIFGVSMSLFCRAMTIDGGGVHFNTVVFC